MALTCMDCGHLHNFDNADGTPNEAYGPDEGTCIKCKGILVEHDGEAVAIFPGKAIIEAVSDGMTAIHLARGKVDRAGN